MSKTKGIYHFAIQALESRLDKIKKKPAKFGKAEERIRSISAALEILRDNNLPERKPLELTDETKAAGLILPSN